MKALAIHLPKPPSRAAPLLRGLLTATQFHIDGPFYVTRPRYTPRTMTDLRHPSDLGKRLQAPQALENLQSLMSTAIRRRNHEQLWCKINIDTKIPAEIRNYETRLRQGINSVFTDHLWPESCAVVFPESLPLILPMLSRIWVPKGVPVDLPSWGIWRRYELADYDEHCRLR